MVQWFGLNEFSSYAQKSAFMKFEKKRRGQALEDLVLRAYGTADSLEEAMMNLGDLIY